MWSHPGGGTDSSEFLRLSLGQRGRQALLGGGTLPHPSSFGGSSQLLAPQAGARGGSSGSVGPLLASSPGLGVLIRFWPLPFCHLANLSPTEAVGRCPWTPTQRRLPHCGATPSPSPACLGDTGTVPSCGHCHFLRDEGLCSRLAWTTPWASRHHLLAPAHLPV